MKKFTFLDTVSNQEFSINKERRENEKKGKLLISRSTHVKCSIHCRTSRVFDNEKNSVINLLPQKQSKNLKREIKKLKTLPHLNQSTQIVHNKLGSV